MEFHCRHYIVTAKAKFKSKMTQEAMSRCDELFHFIAGLTSYPAGVEGGEEDRFALHLNVPLRLAEIPALRSQDRHKDSGSRHV